MYSLRGPSRGKPVPQMLGPENPAPLATAAPRPLKGTSLPLGTPGRSVKVHSTECTPCACRVCTVV